MQTDTAASIIQRAWRKRKHDKPVSDYINTNVRWEDAAIHAQLKVDRNAQDQGKNDPQTRWKRGILMARMLQDENKMLRGAGIEDVGAMKKSLETRHWLELVDVRHRYGSNLKWYHRRWQAEDTTENFFKWLDKGGGKDISLDACPREQLEKERIAYLSAEQRLNYLVKIDQDGKLRWARNDEFVDTSAGLWKDGGPDIGIVPEDAPDIPLVRRGSFGSIASIAISAASTSSNEQENAASHYVGATRGKGRWARAFSTHFTLHGIVDRLLRKTVRKNTWIYVSDKNFNIFVGIKSTGTFQHSSFLAGGVVTSAGLITVKEGVVHTLSPLSGHYRTSIEHFHKFVDVMVDQGVDMHKAKTSKAVAVLWGVEHLGKAKKAQNRALKSVKNGVKDAAEKVVDTVKFHDRDDDYQWKRELIEGRKGKAQEKDTVQNTDGQVTVGNSDHERQDGETRSQLQISIIYPFATFTS